jgi:carboxylesterase
MENNKRPRYSFFLKGNDTAVLLIHGITGTPSEMRYFGKCLNKAGYTVFCNTLPRHCDTLAELKKVTWKEIVDACTEDFQRLKKESKKVFVAGLSMGALVGVHLAYQFPGEVSGIIALAPTLFYDGWAVSKASTKLMEFLWHIPLFRNSIDIREGWPYGTKDEELREGIQRFYKGAKASEFSKRVFLFGSPFFPMACLYQHHLFAKFLKEEMPKVKTPIIILHAEEDDMASVRNARYLFDNIGSGDKTLIVLKDSYHMIVIDKEKDKVAEEAIKFLNQH